MAKAVAILEVGGLAREALGMGGAEDLAPGWAAKRAAVREAGAAAATVDRWPASSAGRIGSRRRPRNCLLCRCAEVARWPTASIARGTRLAARVARRSRWWRLRHWHSPLVSRVAEIVHRVAKG